MEKAFPTPASTSIGLPQSAHVHSAPLLHSGVVGSGGAVIP